MCCCNLTSCDWFVWLKGVLICCVSGCVTLHQRIWVLFAYLDMNTLLTVTRTVHLASTVFTQQPQCQLGALCEMHLSEVDSQPSGMKSLSSHPVSAVITDEPLVVRGVQWVKSICTHTSVFTAPVLWYCVCQYFSCEWWSKAHGWQFCETKWKAISEHFESCDCSLFSLRLCLFKLHAVLTELCNKRKKKNPTYRISFQSFDQHYLGSLKTESSIRRENVTRFCIITCNSNH